MLTSDAVTAPLAELGLTHATATALTSIDPDESPPTMKVLAHRVHCNAPNLTFLVDQLASRGLVTRVPATADRRQRAVRLTPTGEDVRTTVLELTRAASPLSRLDTRELSQVAAILERAGR